MKLFYFGEAPRVREKCPSDRVAFAAAGISFLLEKMVENKMF
jgi:hypothetical protein